VDIWCTYLHFVFLPPDSIMKTFCLVPC